MDPMNIETRYPDYKNKLRKLLTKTKTEKMLSQTGGFLKWLRTKVN